MPSIRFPAATLLVVALLAGAARAGSAQSPRADGAPSARVSTDVMSRDDVASLARVYVAISAVHDSMDVQLAGRFNTTESAQKAVRDTLQARVAAILHHSGLTETEYQHRTFVISTNGEVRKSFDSVVTKLTGVPTPGQLAVAATIQVPAGPAGVHLGHVVNAFNGTPDGSGLLPMALTEARIAVTHAGLGARQPGNLEYMKLHAGHVINAIDPTIVAMGPGRGYGAKKAAEGVANHVELAAKAAGASANVVMHSGQIAGSARMVVSRCDQALALAKQVQDATTAADAATAMTELVSVTRQLVSGDGSLQQAQEQVTLMLAAEVKGQR